MGETVEESARDANRSWRDDTDLEQGVVRARERTGPIIGPAFGSEHSATMSALDLTSGG